MESNLPKEFFKNKSAKLYSKIISSYSGAMLPSDFASYVCKSMKDPAHYEELETKQNDKEQQMKSMTGHIFELLVAEILKYNKIVPFYMQAAMINIPNSKFDFLCFHEDSPVVISTKISLAERWRQSAFEGYFLKMMYRNAKIFVISDNKDEVRLRKKDISSNQILGIDGFCFIRSKGMDELIDDLKDMKFEVAKPVNPIKVSKTKLIF